MQWLKLLKVIIINWQFEIVLALDNITEPVQKTGIPLFWTTLYV